MASVDGFTAQNKPALIECFSALADTGVIEQVIRAGGQTR